MRYFKISNFKGNLVYATLEEETRYLQVSNNSTSNIHLIILCCDRTMKDNYINTPTKPVAI